MIQYKIQKIEFFFLCLLLPGIIIFNGLGQFMFLFLWAATAYCALIYRQYHFNGWQNFFGFNAINWKNLKPVVLRWTVAVIFITVFTWWYRPDLLFQIPRYRPEIIPAIIFMYPIISALPQEFIFCRFFFARYKPIFGEGRLMIIISAIVFAYAHVLFINPIAPVFSFIGGLLFAYTYYKTRSLALVTLEHGLYGIAIFMIGLGHYFYSGAL